MFGRVGEKRKLTELKDSPCSLEVYQANTTSLSTGSSILVCGLELASFFFCLKLSDINPAKQSGSKPVCYLVGMNTILCYFWTFPGGSEGILMYFDPSAGYDGFSSLLFFGLSTCKRFMLRDEAQKNPPKLLSSSLRFSLLESHGIECQSGP